METMECAKCPYPIKRHGSLFVTCRGPCGKSYHDTCAVVPSSEARVMLTSESFFWLCDGCSAAFDKWKSGLTSSTAVSTPNPVELEIAELKCQVTTILETLARISTTFSSSSPSASPGPVASSTLFNGTNENNGQCSTDTNEIEARVENSGKDFSLLLTNVSNSASEEDICDVVSRTWVRRELSAGKSRSWFRIG